MRLTIQSSKDSFVVAAEHEGRVSYHRISNNRQMSNQELADSLAEQMHTDGSLSPAREDVRRIRALIAAERVQINGITIPKAEKAYEIVMKSQKPLADAKQRVKA